MDWDSSRYSWAHKNGSQMSDITMSKHMVEKWERKWDRVVHVLKREAELKKQKWRGTGWCVWPALLLVEKVWFLHIKEHHPYRDKKLEWMNHRFHRSRNRQKHYVMMIMIMSDEVPGKDRRNSKIAHVIALPFQTEIFTY